MPTTSYVTGATGFIGARLVERLLARGDTVRCLVRDPRRLKIPPHERLETVSGSLEDARLLRDSLAECNSVFHLAGLTTANSPEELHAVNIAGSHRTANPCAKQANPPTLVFVSSVAATGPTRRGSVRTEADRPNPVSHYGRSKRGAELAIAEFADRVPTVVVRPGIVFGERDKEVLKMVQTIYRARIHPLAGFPTPPLSLIHVEDLVELLLAAAERGDRLPGKIANAEPAAGAYFACVDCWPDYAQLGRIIRTLLNRPFAPLLHLPDPFAWIAGAGNELVSRVLRRKDTFNFDKIREARSASWACSPARAQRDLGFSPAAPLFARLRQTVEWYREAGWL